MDFKTYFRGLDQSEREAFAKRAETSADYVNIHLVPRNKIPRKENMKLLAEATQGAVSYSEIVDYFYKEEQSEDAA